jgi:4-diphosphocytidyl-2-C-methyl-D-erythritol kinase
VRITVPALAKLNLDLRVLHKRPDGYHELRTIFQTISLRDTLTIDYETARRTQIEIASTIDIADNLIARAARLVLDHLRLKAAIRFSLVKHIPIGAGLGGGSSNAAAVLMALPALAGRRIESLERIRLAEALGSDVPFFLYGGTALGVGRGTELYPLPGIDTREALVIHSGVHVSTGEAYAALGRQTSDALTSGTNSPILREFQTIAWALAGSCLERFPLKNDFEQAVFAAHPELRRSVRKLRRLGAVMAKLTGSGSAIFGIFPEAGDARRAAPAFAAGTAFPVRFVSRRQYRTMWRKALGPTAAASCFGEHEI